jgi:MFS family permease
MLGALAIVFVITGYCGTVTTSAITFVTEEFGSSNAQQGRALAAMRSDIIISLVVMWLADRFGRRRTVVASAAVGIVGTAICSLAPSLIGFAALQIGSRGFVTATAICAAVLGVEETPAAARAWASSLLVACAGIGSGTTLALLPLADLSEQAWRGLYLVPLVALPALLVTRRLLPESARFERTAAERTEGIRAPITKATVQRFATLALWTILMAAYTSPARQYLNDFLRDDRGFNGTGLTVFGLFTNIPAIAGVIMGGRLSDLRGRRFVISIGLFGFAITSALMYSSSGPQMWAAALAQSLAGGLVLPAISIYGPELFPTGFRSRASGMLTGAGRIGSATGLTVVGALADRYGLGRVLAVLSTSLLISALILITLLPETARKELEDLSAEGPRPNPQLFGL